MTLAYLELNHIYKFEKFQGKSINIKRKQVQNGNFKK